MQLTSSLDYFELENGLEFLPVDIQHSWRAMLNKVEPTQLGVWRLVDIWRTRPRSGQENRLIVRTIDENGGPVANVPIAFSYSTADQYPLTENFLWRPPSRQAFVVETGGDGQEEQIQNKPVKQNEPGGITVYCLTPEFSSDYVTGLGALADHTGLFLTFQLRRPGVLPYVSQIKALTARLQTFEQDLSDLDSKLERYLSGEI